MPFDALPRFDDEALRLGRGTALARFDPSRGAAPSDGRLARALPDGGEVAVAAENRRGLYTAGDTAIGRDLGGQLYLDLDAVTAVLAARERPRRPAGGPKLCPDPTLDTPPAGIVVERRPDGGVMMAATTDLFDTGNPAHMAAARAIEQGVLPLSRTRPWDLPPR